MEIFLFREEDGSHPSEKKDKTSMLKNLRS